MIANLVASDKTIIFDHIAKTSGSSVAAWLTSVYGKDRVVWYRHEHHEAVIKKYKDFKFACGHTYFSGKGLSENYKYSTLLRDPFDRVISWLYFCLNNHMEDEIIDTKMDCLRFIKSECDHLCDDVVGNITNNAVDHFCRILGSGSEDDDTRLANAIQAIDSYDVVGLYENMEYFKKSMLALGGSKAIIAKDSPFPFENVTKNRPKIEDISDDLMCRIRNRNELDIYLYEYIKRTRTPRPWFRKFYFR